jgi:hypothetical protein
VHKKNVLWLRRVRPEAEFLDEVQTKDLEVLLLAIHSHLYSFETSISSNSHNVLHISTVQILYTVKEKGGKPGRKPYPLLGRNPEKSLRSFAPCYSQSPLQLCLEISISSNSRNLLHISTVQTLYTV